MLNDNVYNARNGEIKRLSCLKDLVRIKVKRGYADAATREFEGAAKLGVTVHGTCEAAGEINRPEKISMAGLVASSRGFNIIIVHAG